MSTTSYYDEDVYQSNDNGEPDKSVKPDHLELIISSYSGDHKLYMTYTDNQDREHKTVLPKEQAVKLYEQLQSALFYLGYIK